MTGAMEGSCVSRAVMFNALGIVSTVSEAVLGVVMVIVVAVVLVVVVVVVAVVDGLDEGFSVSELPAAVNVLPFDHLETFPCAFCVAAFVGVDIAVDDVAAVDVVFV